MELDPKLTCCGAGCPRASVILVLVKAVACGRSQGWHQRDGGWGHILTWLSVGPGFPGADLAPLIGRIRFWHTLLVGPMLPRAGSF